MIKKKKPNTCPLTAINLSAFRVYREAKLLTSTFYANEKIGRQAPREKMKFKMSKTLTNRVFVFFFYLCPTFMFCRR